MKTFKTYITENLGASPKEYKDISKYFPKRVMKAYIPLTKNAFKLLSVPEGKRDNKYDISSKMKYDSKNTTVILHPESEDTVYYWKFTDNGQELYNTNGKTIHAIPFKSVNLSSIFKEIKDMI